MLEALNRSLFLSLNASDHPSAVLLALALGMGQWLIYAIPALLLGLWLWDARGSRGTVLVAALALLVALCGNQLIDLVAFHPRPFMIPLGHTFLDHAAETSFPSDHATVFFALGVAFCCQHRRRLGMLLVGTGGLVGASRIYLGVHFPFDIVGALLVSVASVWGLLAVLGKAPVHVGLLERLERLYRRLFALPIQRGWVHG